MKDRAVAGSPGSSTAGQHPIHLWVVNQYAAKFPGPGLTRHHFLAGAMRTDGVATTIVSDNPALRGHADRHPRVEDTPEARFVWLWTRRYSGNGVGRVVNMIGFVAAAVRWGWNPRQHDAEPPDVVVGSSPQLFAALGGWILARRHRVPFVLEIRDLWPESLIAILGMSRRHPLVIALAAVEKFLYRRSDHIVGVLDGIGDYVKMRAGRRAAPVTWVPNGVPLDALPQPSPLPQPGNEFRVVYAGSHGPPNGLDTLLEAARLLEADAAEAGPAIRIDLYGDGASKKDLIEYARSHGLRSVHFHNPVSRTEIFTVFAGADAVVSLLPPIYLWRFGISPNKLFDYFAAARPVVLAVDSPGDPVSRADAGLKATAQDPIGLAAALRRMSTTPWSERQAMGRRGREYVTAHHDMSVLGPRFAAVLREAVQRRSGLAQRRSR
jgi:glycosyltransferase involved in cell wall biosynthesis